MSIQSLFHADEWLEMKVSEVIQAMAKGNVGKLQISAGDDDTAVFALVLIRGENTPALLAAMDAKSDELSAVAPIAAGEE
nr:hypothetical protein [uncultured Comamonas sp.]